MAKKVMYMKTIIPVLLAIVILLSACSTHKGSSIINDRLVATESFCLGSLDDASDLSLNGMLYLLDLGDNWEIQMIIDLDLGLADKSGLTIYIPQGCTVVSVLSSFDKDASGVTSVLDAASSVSEWCSMIKIRRCETSMNTEVGSLVIKLSLSKEIDDGEVSSIVFACGSSVENGVILEDIYSLPVDIPLPE